MYVDKWKGSQYIYMYIIYDKIFYKTYVRYFSFFLCRLDPGSCSNRWLNRRQLSKLCKSFFIIYIYIYKPMYVSIIQLIPI